MRALKIGCIGQNPDFSVKIDVDLIREAIRLIDGCRGFCCITTAEQWGRSRNTIYLLAEPTIVGQAAEMFQCANGRSLCISVSESKTVTVACSTYILPALMRLLIPLMSRYPGGMIKIKIGKINVAPEPINAIQIPAYRLAKPTGIMPKS